VNVRRLDLLRWNVHQRFAEMVGACERLLSAARAVGDADGVAEAAYFLFVAFFAGPAPVAEGRAAIARLRRESMGPLGEAGVTNAEGLLLAMEGRFDEARPLVDRARRTYEELGLAVKAHGTLLGAAFVERAAGEVEAAERALREGSDGLRAMGETGYLSTFLGFLGEALYLLGRYEEADEAARESERLTQPGDTASETLWRSVRSRLLARRGEADEALRLAREANAWIETTDALVSTADQYVTYAEVLRLAGRDAEAVAALERALELYERKGHLPLVERTRASIAALRGLSTPSSSAPARSAPAPSSRPTAP
jgi:tetratricopeptide (TPR) repeat protein